MPDKPDEEIRKSIKRFEESLPESERNPDAQLGDKRNVHHIPNVLYNFLFFTILTSGKTFLQANSMAILIASVRLIFKMLSSFNLSASAWM